MKQKQYFLPLQGVLKIIDDCIPKNENIERNSANLVNDIIAITTDYRVEYNELQKVLSKYAFKKLVCDAHGISHIKEELRKLKAQNKDMAV